eukprot:jgi/Chrzof1/14950/Cz09g21260.t1
MQASLSSICRAAPILTLLLEQVSIGNGVLPYGTTNNEAEYVGLIQGLKTAALLGITRLDAYGDSQLVIRQVTSVYHMKSSKLKSRLDEVKLLQSGFEGCTVHHIDRNINTLADAQANLALDLDSLLLCCGKLKPSEYASVARRLSKLLGLPQSVQRNLEAADDFVQDVVKIVAVRCGVDESAVAARIPSPHQQDTLRSNDHAAADSTSTSDEASTSTDSTTRAAVLCMPGLQLVRHYSPAEGAAYKEALDANNKRISVLHSVLPPLGLYPLVNSTTSSPSSTSSPILNVIPQPTTTEPTVQPARDASDYSSDEQLMQSVHQDSGCNDVLAEAYAAVEMMGGGFLQQLRYIKDNIQLDDTSVTHLLMFDGASRNNPGRGGYGYALFDLYKHKLIAKGCRTLPYGNLAVVTEFHGLLAGLDAAKQLGIKRLAIAGDSQAVIAQMKFNSIAANIAVNKLKLQTILHMKNFEHVEFHPIAREYNYLADKLANISMDVDTALYAILRKDLPADQAIQALMKAARVSSKSERAAKLLEQIDLSSFVVSFVRVIMNMSVDELLSRLEDKAARMGDRNASLVQEVRRIAYSSTQSSWSDAAAAALLMDGRDPLARTKLNKALQQRLEQQQQQQPQEQQQSRAQVSLLSFAPEIKSDSSAIATSSNLQGASITTTTSSSSSTSSGICQHTAQRHPNHPTRMRRSRLVGMNPLATSAGLTPAVALAASHYSTATATPHHADSAGDNPGWNNVMQGSLPRAFCCWHHIGSSSCAAVQCLRLQGLRSPCQGHLHTSHSSRSLASMCPTFTDSFFVSKGLKQMPAARLVKRGHQLLLTDSCQQHEQQQILQPARHINQRPLQPTYYGTLHAAGVLMESTCPRAHALPCLPQAGRNLYKYALSCLMATLR